MHGFDRISASTIFKDFVRVKREDMSLLEAPMLKMVAQDHALQHKIYCVYMKHLKDKSVAETELR